MTQLFPGAISEWTVPQKQMLLYLRYYDNFYEAWKQQSYIIEVGDKELVKAWMVDYDIIVDAFLVWYDYKSKEKREVVHSEAHEAQVPHSTDHSTVMKAAHR